MYWCRSGTLPPARVRITDFMPPRHHHPRIFRLVEGLRGEVEVTGQLVIRFEYGYQVPWVTQTGDGIRAIAGPDLVEIDSPVPQEPVHMHHESVVRREGRGAIRVQAALGSLFRRREPGPGMRHRPGRNA